MIITISILLGVCLFLLYVCWNLYRKINRVVKERLFYKEWVDEFARRIETVNQGLKIIDIHGSFEADDEIGVAFKEIKELLFLLTHMNSLLNIDDIMKKYYQSGNHIRDNRVGKIY